MSVLNEDQWLGAPDTVSSYQIQRSLRFNSSDSAYLSRTPAAAGNRKTWTWSGWVKRSGLGARNGIFAADNATAPYFFFELYSDNRIKLEKGGANGYSVAYFRDTSAWYHFILAVDTTQATAAARQRLYVNGVEQSIDAFFALNEDTAVNLNGAVHSIGSLYYSTPNSYHSGYLADIHFIDGQALTPSSFGEFDTNGEWQPKAYTGTYGTNGFKLNFADNSAATAAALGKDTSGNGNNWTPNNLSVTAGAGNDSLVDTPTSYGTDTGVGGEVRGNYCTLNPLDQSGSNTFSNGNLDIVVAADNNTPTTVACSSISVSSGKWYWEVTPTAMTTAGGMIGVGDFGQSPASRSWRASGGWYYYGNSGQKYNSGSGAAYGASYANNDVIGVALDLDVGTIVFYKNGVTQGTAYSTGLTGKFIGPVFANGTSGGTQAYSVNFGQRPFAYPVSGFKALCDTNLTAGTITTSGSFTGNANADGPSIWLNGVPVAMSINGNSVTFGTHADKLANGFKLRTNSVSYNLSGTNNFSVTAIGDKFKFARAQANP